MEATVRVTGRATAVYDPQNDAWVSPQGTSKTLTTLSLFNDHAVAQNYVEAMHQGRKLLLVSVDLALDIRSVRQVDAEYRKVRPGYAHDPKAALGG